ncbi:site-specific integrase (plasmid) [Streptomyces sp. P8-A8]|uniref:site-specific integrase n=1 Tax=Streptomyces sp. P8-A8 TaxID=3029759 RepID=UPI0036DBDD3B
MTTALTTTTAAFDGRSAVFAGSDVCREAGFLLPEGARRPVFEDDVWDFTDVVGLPVQLALATRRFEFTGITDERWRMVGKELVLAMFAPRHPAVAPLPRAHRTALHLSSCAGRLDELIRFFRWLSEHGVSNLAQVDTRICDAYMAHRRYVLDEHRAVVGEQSPAVRRAAAQVVVDLVNYRELFTADRVPADLRPWGGATASAIAEMPSGRTENKTQPVDDVVLQPMLAAALFLVSSLGPHAVELAHQIREADKLSARKARGLRSLHVAPVAEFTELLSEYTETCTPLPMLTDHHVADRLANGWSADDRLLTVATGVLARQAGITQFEARWMSRLRGPLEDAAASVGVKEVFARNAVEITMADTSSVLPWTLPLHRSQAVALVGIVRTATMIVLATASGMRSSELMELRIGCRLPLEEPVPGLTRYRLASKVIKGQPLGGTDDEWVVIEPVYRAVELAEDLHDDRQEGTLLFGRFAFSVRYKWFRNWVNSPAGQRLGLAPIPDGQVNLRRLRRTLALEMAYRPGGVLASKIHLKHIAVATTEGYASRPGGAQAELLAEVNKHESDRNLQLVLEEFQNYQQGVLPTGPGARNLTEFFASIDEKLVGVHTYVPSFVRMNRDSY